MTTSTTNEALEGLLRDLDSLYAEVITPWRESDESYSTTAHKVPMPEDLARKIEAFFTHYDQVLGHEAQTPEERARSYRELWGEDPEPDPDPGPRTYFSTQAELDASRMMLGVELRLLAQGSD